ncbi:MAG: ABC transporter substrate-binding protein [Chloroflexi bacterium]|nr:ABC transporter substrate-binding protein [Chloroflexota bacterium]
MQLTNKSRIGLFSVALILVASLSISACAATATPTPTKAPASAETKAPAATKPAGAATKAPESAATKAPEPTKPAAKAPAPPAGPSTQIKFADAASFAYAPLYWAIEKGYFKEAGIDFTFDTKASAADIVPFLATGQLDMAGGGLSAAYFNAIARGIDLKIITPMGLLPPKRGSVPIVVTNELYEKASPKTAAALKGKTVAINAKGGIVEYILTKALQKEGLDLKDVETIILSFPDMPTALAGKKVDAIVTAEPYGTRAVQLGAGKVLLDDILPGKSTTVMFASPKLVTDRPEILKSFMVAWMRGVRDLQDESKLYTDDKMAVWVKYTKLQADVIKAMAAFNWDPDLNIQKDVIADQQKVHGDHGLLNYKEPIPVEKMIDESFAKYAREKLGPWKKQ